MVKAELFSVPMLKHDQVLRVVAAAALSSLVLASVFSSELFAGSGIANEVASKNANGSSLINALIAGIALLSLAVLTVGALTLWSRKQDRVGIMMSLCMRSLINSKNESESSVASVATKTLSHAKDEGALLVLLDVFSDEKVGEDLHKTVGAALNEMGTNFRKYKGVINELTAAVEQNDHQKVIDVLISNFEGRDRVYVQTAFIIGRKYLNLGKFVEARDWFQTAVFRNRKNPLYGSQIKRMIDTCNIRLFMQGDAAFQASNLHEAKIYFSQASYSLDEASKRRFSPFLRLACVYCKLEAYEDASQAVLQALQNQQEPETSVTLSKLLNSLRSAEQTTSQRDEEINGIRNQIDVLTISTMNRLAIRN